MGGRGQLSPSYTFRDKKELKTGLRKNGISFIGKITNKQLPVTSYLGSEVSRLNRRYGKSIIGLALDVENIVVPKEKVFTAINTPKGVVGAIGGKAFTKKRISKKELSKLAIKAFTISYMAVKKRNPEEYVAIKKKYGATLEKDLYKKLLKEFK